MAHAPVVSVIVPTFNRAVYLREAVDSVVAQHYSHWELLVVDDGSTDGTREFLDRLTDPRIHPIVLAHCGNPAMLRNRALARATGEYVALLDSDDTWLPHKLERQLTAFRESPGPRWGYTFHARMDGDGNEGPLPPWDHRRHHDGNILREIISTDAWIAVATVMIERSLLEEVGGFDETLPASEDYELFLRLARASECRLVPEVLTRVRLHAGNRAAAREVEVFQTWAEVLHRLLDDPTMAPHHAFCRRHHARALVWVAERYRRRRAYGRALAALGRAFRYQPTLREWWLGLVKTCIDPLVPGRFRRGTRSGTA